MKKKSNQHDFVWRTGPSIFTSIAPVLLDLSNETSWLSPALKSTSHFLPQSAVPRRSESSSEANSGCCHRSDAWSQSEQRLRTWGVVFKIWWWASVNTWGEHGGFTMMFKNTCEGVHLLVKLLARSLHNFHGFYVDFKLIFIVF